MKKYAAYFGKNIARIIYIISVGFLGLGIFNAFFYHRWLGGVFCTIGALLFIVTSAKQVSDKHIDELILKIADEYGKEKIEGKTIDKQVLDSKKFSVFKGFIRDSGDVRFKAGRDSKIRTSRFYVTALSVEKNDCKVFTTVYDILTDTTPIDRMISTKGADEIEFKREAIEFPRGNFRCELKVTRGEKVEELVFYLPDDALADKLTAKIK